MSPQATASVLPLSPSAGAAMHTAGANDALGAEAASMAPVLLRDMTLMLSQLGIESIRASLVDLESATYRPAWSITERGETSDNPCIHGGDGPLPWAEGMIAKLDEVQPEHTLVQKLSPRYWGFAWRYDDHRAAVAAVLYRDWRDEHSDAHNALVRLVCDIGIRAQETAPPGRAGDHLPLGWPAVERRRQAQAGAASKRKHLLARAAAAFVLAATLALAALTFERATTLAAEMARLQAMADSSMTLGLSAALATGDYGEVQAALSSFSSLGYFKGAVVTNARQRVISTAGVAGEARIGDNLPPSVSQIARSQDLVQGSVRHGQLLILGANAPVAPGTSLRLALAAVMLGCTAIGAAAALFFVRYRRQRSLRA